MSLRIESMPFYYDQEKAGQLSYRDYQHKIAMTQDITDSIESNTERSITANAFFIESINSRIVDSQIASTNAMYNNTQEMIGAFNSGLTGISDQLQSGFSSVSNQLQSGFSYMSRQIGEMNANMNMAFAALNSTVQESAKAIYDLLEKLNDMVNNPSQTNVLDLFRRASLNYEKGYYEEARDELLDAIAINKTYYRSWFLLGKTYLHGASEFSVVIDLDKAVEALNNAAKYIKADAKTHEEVKKEAAEIYFYLGLSQQFKAMDMFHIKNEFEYNNYLEQAIESYRQSQNYSSKMLESIYNCARCKIFLGNTQGALKDLETIVLQDRNYCIKVYIDNDFSSIYEQFTDLIKKMKKVAFVSAKNDYETIKTLLLELASLGETTNITIPLTFTEELPYFDLRVYADNFKNNISFLEDNIPKIKEIKSRKRTAKYQVCISVSEENTFGLKTNGTIVVAGGYIGSFGEKKISALSGIIAIVTRNDETYCLKADGTVVKIGKYGIEEDYKLKNFHNIVAIAAGWDHVIGLKADGTVIAGGINSSGACDVNNWHDIVAVAAGTEHTVGLKTDGTVIATENNSGECNVGDWQDIIAVTAGHHSTFGLKADGTVVVVGSKMQDWNRGVYRGALELYDREECKVDNWRDIIALATSGSHTVGLKSDGTVVATGKNDYGQCNVSSWRDIIAVAAGGTFYPRTIGLKADGTVVVVGRDDNRGVCNIGDWQDIGIIS